jgi:hypothetical protein
MSQFPQSRRVTAAIMLSRLRFISRDRYSSWFHKVMLNLPKGVTHALYSVRKLDRAAKKLWNPDGAIVGRPGTSLGSEDLVYSLIANAVRANPAELLDHPSLGDLREKRIRSYVLIDDSIGSGDRVSGFINAMLSNSTFRSWWSYGLVRILVASLSRSQDAEYRILSAVRGSDHGRRKFRKSAKISFTSDIVYSAEGFEHRWGEHYPAIFELCKDQLEITRWECFGYGDVMANIVFYHSVPDNIPGVFWVDNGKWKGLFPGRSLPGWALTLLGTVESENVPSDVIDKQFIGQLLLIIKRGVRSLNSIAIRLNCDQDFAKGLLSLGRRLGLLTDLNRITERGLDWMRVNRVTIRLPSWDFSMYVPTSWCAGQATIQPPAAIEPAPSRLVDSGEVSFSPDGGIGQMPLGRTDAKAASPPVSVLNQEPAMSRKVHDTDGPMGSKDR